MSGVIDVSDDESLSDIVAANMSENPEDDGNRDENGDMPDTLLYDTNEGKVPVV